MDSLTPAQFAEWQAYLDGIGETDDQLNAATTTSLVVNELRHLRYTVAALVSKDAKPDKAIKPEDLLRRWRKEAAVKKRQSASEIHALLKSYG